MGLAALYGGYLIGSYIYHRITADHPPKPQPAKNIEVPRTDDGASYPLIYGTCRVRSPILAFASNPTASGSGPWQYRMDFLMVLGIPFEQAQVRLGRIWVDEVRLGPVTPQWSKVANGVGGISLGGYFMDTTGSEWLTQQGYIGQRVEVYDGNASQHFVDPVTLAPLSVTAVKMIDAGLDADKIPGYRGFVSVGHHNGPTVAWDLGEDNVMGAYNYEVCSQPPGYAWGVGFNGFTSIDANPVDVIYDLLTGKFGKLNFPSSKIDAVSFQSARYRLWEEGHGYSRAIEDAVDLDEILREICEQIDAFLFEDPRDGLVKIRLVRDDYAFAGLPHITTSNCEDLDGAAGGYEGKINKVRVIFSNRDDQYRDGSGTAHSLASAAGLNGDVREILIRMPGVCTQALADQLAARELAARSRPIARYKAIVSREFHAVNPGDVVKVTWPDYGIAERVFRVVQIDRGSLENGRIALDLLEDFYNVYRAEVQPGNPWSPPSFEPSDPEWTQNLEPAGGGTPWIGGGGSSAPSGTGFVYVTGGVFEDPALSGTAATALLDVFTTSVKGLVPAATGGSTTVQFLRKDGTWTVPPGTGVTGAGLIFLFGGDHDGAVTFDGTTTVLGIVPSSNTYTLNRDVFLTNMTVNSGVTIRSGGYRIFGSGTLTNNGDINNNGGDGLSNSGGAVSTQGIYISSGIGASPTNNNNGSAGGASGNTPAFPGGATSTTSLGGAIAGAGTAGNVMFRGGGGGGAAATRTGGSGGNVTISAATSGGPSLEALRRGALDGQTGSARFTPGSGGGSGGSPAVGSGGGGGGGGGIVGIFFKEIVNNGTIRANGGNGFNAGSAGGGGGGGGGGGLVVVCYSTRSGSGTVTAAGGTGGTGNAGGGAGGAGANGYTALYNLSGDGT